MQPGSLPPVGPALRFATAGMTHKINYQYDNITILHFLISFKNRQKWRRFKTNPVDLRAVSAEIINDYRILTCPAIGKMALM